MAELRTTLERREIAIVGGLAVLGLAIRVAFVLTTGDHTLAGDEIEYDMQGRFFADGKWFWSETPTGSPHPSLWKVPGYTLFVGGVYSVLGSDYDNALLVQTLLGPVTIFLSWLLGRRLFSPAVGIAAAAVVAVHPFAWQFETRLYAESIVTPFTVLILLLVLDRDVTWRRAAGVGVLLGLMLLTRPSALYLVPGIAAAWLLAAGWRRGALATVATVVAACLVVLPWSLRNQHVSGEFVPFSVQDAAPFGTFNDDAANDPKYPYAWRFRTTRERDLLRNISDYTEVELRRTLRRRSFDYIRAHPDSVPKAFFWNGLSRLWDVRRPAHILGEAEATARSRKVAGVGVALHFVLLPLAILALWLFRRRRGIVVPVLAIALSASIVFTVQGSTRYRAPFEPLIAILAVAAVWHLVDRRRAARSA